VAFGYQEKSSPSFLLLCFQFAQSMNGQTRLNVKNLQHVSTFRFSSGIGTKITPKITGGFNSVRRPVFYKLENTTFRELDLHPSSGDEGKTTTQLGHLERANLKSSD
jgi:hypothetical protein